MRDLTAHWRARIGRFTREQDRAEAVAQAARAAALPFPPEARTPAEARALNGTSVLHATTNLLVLGIGNAAAAAYWAAGRGNGWRHLSSAEPEDLEGGKSGEFGNYVLALSDGARYFGKVGAEFYDNEGFETVLRDVFDDHPAHFWEFARSPAALLAIAECCAMDLDCLPYTLLQPDLVRETLKRSPRQVAALKGEFRSPDYILPVLRKNGEALNEIPEYLWNGAYVAAAVKCTPGLLERLPTKWQSVCAWTPPPSPAAG